MWKEIHGPMRGSIHGERWLGPRWLGIGSEMKKKPFSVRVKRERERVAMPETV